MKWGVRRKIAKQARYNDRMANKAARKTDPSGRGTKRDRVAQAVGSVNSITGFVNSRAYDRSINGGKNSVSGTIAAGIGSGIAYGVGYGGTQKIANAVSARKKYKADVASKGQKATDNELLAQYNARKATKKRK